MVFLEHEPFFGKRKMVELFSKIPSDCDQLYLAGLENYFSRPRKTGAAILASCLHFY